MKMKRAGSLEDSHTDDVKSVILKVSKQRDSVCVVCADSVGIVDVHNLLSVIRYQDNVGTLGETFFHAVAVAIRRSFCAARGTTDVSVDSLIGS